MEISRTIPNNNIPSNTGNKTENSNFAVAAKGESSFTGNGNDASAAFPLDVHVTSNVGDLRVFPEDKNLYEIVLNKEASPKRKEMNWQALAGSLIGTAIPALIFYRAKLKKGQVNFKVIQGLDKLVNSSEPEKIAKLNYANAKSTILEVAQDIKTKATPEVQEGLNKLFEKLDKIENPDKALSKLLDEVGLEKNLEKLNDRKFYFEKGIGLYIKNTLKETKDLYKKLNEKGNIIGENSFFTYLKKTDDLSLKEVLLIGLGSITGGYLGGVAKDEGDINRKKTKEATYQLINNIICPTILTEQLVKAFKLNIKPPKEVIEKNPALKLKRYGLGAAAIIIGVGTGVNIGTKIANFVNKQYFKDEKYERKIGKFDVFIHVDDIPLALNFMHFPFMDKFLLLCSALCGYEAGKKD